MTRSIRRSAMSRAVALALMLVVFAGLPAEAASTWTKLLTTPGEAQAMAPAPGGGVYVATSPIDSGATAVLYRYKSDGSVAWKKVLGTGGVFIRGLASDSSGNAYVAYMVSTQDGSKGYPYRLQRVTKTGTLGWVTTWYDDDMSLTGDLVALSGSTLYVAERDAATGSSTIRRFKTSTGKSSSAWKLSGAKKPADRPVDLVVHAGALYLLDISGGLFRIRSDGTVQWKKQLPGTPDGGGASDGREPGCERQGDLRDVQRRLLRRADPAIQPERHAEVGQGSSQRRRQLGRDRGRGWRHVRGR